MSRDGRRLLPSMAFSFYAKITDDDLEALIVYLRSLKPLPAERESASDEYALR